MKEQPEVARERLMREKLEAGEVIEMAHPHRGVCYVENDPAAIVMKERQGFTHVTYTEETVKKAVVSNEVKQMPKKRPRKQASAGSDGE